MDSNGFIVPASPIQAVDTRDRGSIRFSIVICVHSCPSVIHCSCLTMNRFFDTWRWALFQPGYAPARQIIRGRNCRWLLKTNHEQTQRPMDILVRRSHERKPTRERGRPARMHSRCVPLGFPVMRHPASLPAGTAWARPKQSPGVVAGRPGWMKWPRLYQDGCRRDARAPARRLFQSLLLLKRACTGLPELSQRRCGTAVTLGGPS